MFSALGCKRVIFDTDYFSTLHQPNMALNWDGVASISENAILTGKGGCNQLLASSVTYVNAGEDLPFDTIILATGYCTVREIFALTVRITKLQQDNYPLTIRGIEGQTIQEYFASQGGPTAYLGTSVPGFPNFYMIGGMCFYRHLPEHHIFSQARILQPDTLQLFLPKKYRYTLHPIMAEPKSLTSPSGQLCDATY